MRTVPKLKEGGSAKPQRTPHLEVRLPLTLMTPMIGGGVKALTPDREVPVRPTAIRGALRWWWRVLSPIADLDDLRLAEAEIFGGVNLPAKKDTAASWLSVRVENVANLRKVPAGAHRVDGGLPKTLPEWNMPRGLAYALFPLQASIDERRAWRGGGNMPTKEVIDRLDFDLVLRMDRRWKLESGAYVEVAPPGKESIDDLLRAVHWWLHFGGVGARTRRGFGAVRLREGKITLHGEGIKTEQWKATLPELPALPVLKSGESVPDDRPSLYGAQLWLGETEQSAEHAHEVAVGTLRDFRQAPGLGRDPTNPETRRPGRSRWPEPDLVKVVADTTPYDHALPKSASTSTRQAPRAAFGLPILIRFKDNLDAKADADLVALPPKGASTDRWASPLIVRAVRADGKFRPAALVLFGAAVPWEVRVKIVARGSGNKTQDSVVNGSQGSREHILQVLSTAKGDALKAFCMWLKDEYKYQLVGEKKA